MPLLLLRLKSKKWITNDDEEYHLNCDDDHQRDQFTNESHTLKMDKKPNFFRIAVVKKGASERTVQRWPLVKESNVYTQPNLKRLTMPHFILLRFIAKQLLRDIDLFALLCWSQDFCQEVRKKLRCGPAYNE